MYSSPSSKQHLDPSAALRGLQHDLLLKKMSSSSPDLISTSMEAEGRRRGLERPGLERGGSQSASAGLGGGEFISLILSDRNICIQCSLKVFKTLDFFQMLLRYSLILKRIQLKYFLIKLHTIHYRLKDETGF
jgi:hypothetical protein